MLRERTFLHTTALQRETAYKRGIADHDRGVFTSPYLRESCSSSDELEMAWGVGQDAGYILAEAARERAEAKTREIAVGERLVGKFFWLKPEFRGWVMSDVIRPAHMIHEGLAQVDGFAGCALPLNDYESAQWTMGLGCQTAVTSIERYYEEVPEQQRPQLIHIFRSAVSRLAQARPS